MKIVSSFEITGWDATPYGEEGEGPLLSEAHVVKRYQGDLDGEGRVRLLMCRASADGPLENAGYIASEQVSGTLGGDADGKHIRWLHGLGKSIRRPPEGSSRCTRRTLDLPSSRSPQMRQASYEIARTLRPCSTLPSGT